MANGDVSTTFDFPFDAVPMAFGSGQDGYFYALYQDDLTSEYFLGRFSALTGGADVGFTPKQIVCNAWGNVFVWRMHVLADGSLVMMGDLDEVDGVATAIYGYLRVATDGTIIAPPAALSGAQWINDLDMLPDGSGIASFRESGGGDRILRWDSSGAAITGYGGTPTDVGDSNFWNILGFALLPDGRLRYSIHPGSSIFGGLHALAADGTYDAAEYVAPGASGTVTSILPNPDGSYLTLRRGSGTDIAVQRINSAAVDGSFPTITHGTIYNVNWAQLRALGTDAFAATGVYNVSGSPTFWAYRRNGAAVDDMPQPSNVTSHAFAYAGDAIVVGGSGYAAAYGAPDDRYIAIEYEATPPVFQEAEVNDGVIASSAPVMVDSIIGVTDGIDVADAMTAQLVARIAETLRVADGVEVDRRLLVTIADGVLASDRLRLVFETLITDGVTLSAVLAGDRVVTTALVESLVASDTCISTRDALAAVVEAVALADVLRSVQEGSIADAAALADAIEARANALIDLVSMATLTDTAEALAVITVVVAERVDTADALSGAASWLTTINDAVAVGVTLEIDGIPYTAYVMNADSRGVSEYAGFNFNSLATFNRATYGAGAAGLYQLGGDTDDGEAIVARLRTAQLKVANGRQSGVDAAYLGWRGNGSFQLKAITTRDGVRRADVYELTPAPSDGHTNARIKLGKGLKSAYWAFELTLTGATDFDLDVLAVHPLTMKRRVP